MDIFVFSNIIYHFCFFTFYSTKQEKTTHIFLSPISLIPNNTLNIFYFSLLSLLVLFLNSLSLRSFLQSNIAYWICDEQCCQIVAMSAPWQIAVAKIQHSAVEKL